MQFVIHLQPARNDVRDEEDRGLAFQLVDGLREALGGGEVGPLFGTEPER